MKNYLMVLLIVLGSCLPMNAEVNTDGVNAKKLCDAPRIYYLKDFVSQEECDYLVRKATPHLERSRVVGKKANENVLNRARTSSGAFIPTADDLVMNKIEKRIQKLTGFPPKNGEDFHILHYEIGQEYVPHYDYFAGDNEGTKSCLARGGQRVATVILFLHDTEKGGETIFPRVNITVPPKKGDAVLFYNLKPDNELEPLSLHGGAPVIKGEKWIATKWIRLGAFR